MSERYYLTVHLLCVLSHEVMHKYPVHIKNGMHAHVIVFIHEEERGGFEPGICAKCNFYMSFPMSKLQTQPSVTDYYARKLIRNKRMSQSLCVLWTGLMHVICMLRQD